MVNDAEQSNNDLRIFRGDVLIADKLPTSQQQEKRLELIPAPPPWRSLRAVSEQRVYIDKPPSDSDQRGCGFIVEERAVELVNAALCLRRPLLIQGNPGSGKTSLAYSVAKELGLPGPYRWSITSRVTLKDGLYDYDAIGRLQEASLIRQQKGDTGEIETPDVGDFIRLGPLGMAFYQSRMGRPAVLLIDEIDKSDIDLPNDLLHILEEGFFEIPELSRLKIDKVDILPHRNMGETSLDKVPIFNGLVQCEDFPLILMTSNEAREFPPAFLRRCLRLNLNQPENEDKFYEILAQRFEPALLSAQQEEARALIGDFLKRIQKRDKTLATDQLLNAVYMLLQGKKFTYKDRDELLEALFQSL